jgi:hypothetical protein
MGAGARRGQGRVRRGAASSRSRPRGVAARGVMAWLSRVCLGSPHRHAVYGPPRTYWLPGTGTVLYRY